MMDRCVRSTVSCITFELPAPRWNVCRQHRCAETGLEPSWINALQVPDWRQIPTGLFAPNITRRSRHAAPAVAVDDALYRWVLDAVDANDEKRLKPA